ncbi:uncharacterized protein TNCV_68701 [Trichonephila clavipes]|nr:uncharacterized protein TNCV_68701 [Trichonephila clavipes]
MPVVSCNFEHHAGDSTIGLGSKPNLGRTFGGGQRPPTSLPLPPTSREDLQLDGYSEYPNAAKALYMYKHPGFLQDLNPSLRTQQSALLTTMPNGRQNIYKKNFPSLISFVTC